MAQSKATSANAQDKAVELDKALVKLREWQEAAAAARKATALADRLKAEFQAFMAITESTVGTVRGLQVVSYRPTEAFRGAEFRQARPDLVQHYTRQVTVEELDVVALRRDLPRVYEQFRSRTMKPDWKALDTALSLPANEQ